MAKFKKFLKDCDGATAIEYGLIAAIMATAIIAGIGNFGSSLENHFVQWANWYSDKSPDA